MHVHSLLPFVALTTLTVVTASNNLVITQNLPTNWRYAGCFSDSTAARALNQDSYADGNGMTQETCIAYCDSKGYPVAGVEYSRECFCDFDLGPSASAQLEDDCSMACSGDSTEKCGGPARLNVFSTGAKPPATNPGVGGYASIGCYTDSQTSRTLTTSMNIDGNSMSVSACTSACSSAGFTYAGVEFGRECYCGNSIEVNGAPANDGCTKVCTGNKGEWCGGAGFINIYQAPTSPPPAGKLPDGWSAQGCYTDSVSARALEAFIPITNDKMTIEACIEACGQLSFSLVGVEFGQECFCGSALRNGAVKATSGCNMACRGNTGETCGGANRLNLFAASTSQIDPNDFCAVNNNVVTGLRTDTNGAPYCSEALSISTQTFSTTSTITPTSATVTATVTTDTVVVTTISTTTITTSVAATSTSTIVSDSTTTVTTSTLRCLTAAFTAPVAKVKRTFGVKRAVQKPAAIPTTWAPNLVTSACSCLSLPTPSTTLTYSVTLAAGTVTVTETNTPAATSTSVTTSTSTTTTATITSKSTSTRTVFATATIVVPGSFKYRKYTNSPTRDAANEAATIYPVASLKTAGRTPDFSGAMPNANFQTANWPNSPNYLLKFPDQTTTFDSSQAVVVMQGYFVAPRTATYTIATSASTVDNYAVVWINDNAYTWTIPNQAYWATRARTNTGGSVTFQLNAGDAIPMTLLWANGGIAARSSFTILDSVSKVTVEDTTGFFAPACDTGSPFT